MIIGAIKDIGHTIFFRNTTKETTHYLMYEVVKMKNSTLLIKEVKSSHLLKLQR